MKPALFDYVAPETVEEAVAALAADETGTIPVSQVIASAMEDAFAPLGIAPVRESPMSPDMIHGLLSEARSR